jgi:hypothetical protein
MRKWSVGVCNINSLYTSQKRQDSNKWEWYESNLSYLGSVVTNTSGADLKIRIQKISADSNSNLSSMEN